MPSDARTGATVAGFRIDTRIGEGAMGSVYAAEDTRRGGRVALKVLARDLSEDERFRRRFLRESRLAATLDDPHVVRIVDSGEENGALYLAMELVDGIDLRELLRREGRLEPERALDLLGQVASALDAAHAAGLVHRDVKPANILVREGPEGEHVYVCDFGLARHLSSASSLTTDRGLVGTIDYIPPEQIEGGEIDGRADVYSLACVLFECLAGERPFDRESELSVVFAHLNEPAPRVTDLRPELPAGFDALFSTALAKSPGDRYSTCGELVAAGNGALHGGPVGRRRRGRRRLALLAGVAIIAAAAVIGGVTLGGDDATAAPAITETSIAGAPLGLRRPDYEKLLGHAIRVHQPTNDAIGPGTGYATLAFEEAKVWVFFPDGFDGTGQIIATWNEDYLTAAGIGPCSSIDDMKEAYGDRVTPDHYGTIGKKHFMYDVGKNLLFAAAGPDPPPGTKPVPATYVSNVGLFDGNAPGANESFGERPFAGFVTGNETPHCVP